MSIDRGRIRWQCRRALLELDLVFTRFFEKHFDSLSENQLADLQDMLKCEDHDIWGMINGSMPCINERWREMIELLREK